MTEIEELREQRRQIDQRLKQLTGSLTGSYIKCGSLRFGKPHKPTKFNPRKNEYFELAVYDNEMRKYRTFMRFKDLDSVKFRVNEFEKDLFKLEQKIVDESELWNP